MRRAVIGSLVVSAGLALAGSASATWSIVIVNTRTGEVAAASATCLTGFDLQANTPVVLTGIGAGTAQSSVDNDSTNRTFVRDRFLQGVAPSAILSGLSTFDTQHQSRQYGMVDVFGRAATFTGTGAGQWAGGKTGRVGDLVYAVQGNVLTGAPVVDAAVAAIETTPGDMPAKLMAAMEAARFYGGDGRCSCTTGAPPSCGSPPPSFTKAAHIAYMLIARTGDTDGSNPMYKANSAAAIAVADFNGDGKKDIVTSGDSTSISVLNNVSQSGKFASFAQGFRSPQDGVLREIATSDLNGDGKPDVVGVQTNAAFTLVYINIGAGQFAPVNKFNNDAVAVGLVAGDFNGDHVQDIVTVEGTAQSLSLFAGHGDGTLEPPAATFIGGGTPTLVQAADMDGDGDLDLIVGTSSPNTIVIFTNNGGAFTRGTVLAADAVISALLVADLDADTRNDVVYSMTGDASFRFARNTGTGFNTIPIAANGNTGGLAVRDVTGDGLPDLVTVLRSTSRLMVLPQSPGGGFNTRPQYPLGFGRNRLALEDFNGDGNIDVAMPLGGVLVLNATGKGTYPKQSGLGGGDFFLTLNVPNQTAADPDPVFTLRSRFDTWRAALVGAADAVASTATLDRPTLQADGFSKSTLTIQLRDFSGAPVAASLDKVELTNTSGVPLTTVTPLVLNPDGTFSATLTAGGICGTDHYKVRVTSGARPVVLMPETIVILSAAADINADGYLTGDDYDLFADLFIAGDLGADFNHDGSVTGDDFDAFVLKFEGGC